MVRLAAYILLVVSLVCNAVQKVQRDADQAESAKLEQRIIEIANEYASTKKDLAAAVIERDKAIEAKEGAEAVRDETERQCLVTQASVGSVFQTLRDEEGEECFTSFRDAILHPSPHLIAQSRH